MLLFTRAIVLLSLSMLFSSAANTSELTPFSIERSGLLFSLQGSNTVGARLAPELVRDYLLAKGLRNVTIQPKSQLNEYTISGFLAGSSEKIYVDLAAHGSTTGFKSLLKGKADIAMSSRAIKSKEVTQLKALGAMRSFAAEKVIAIDGLAVIVHPDNPIYKLDITQIRQIFNGTIKDWSELGAKKGKITLYARDENSGTWDTFKNLVLVDGNGKKFSLANSAQRFESNDELSFQVQNDQYAIGFVGLAAVGNAQPLSVADNNSPALLPTQLSVATEDYPLARRLYMYVSPYNNDPIIAEFLKFAQGNIGQDRVQKVGYISQKPMLLANTKLASAPDQYLEWVKKGQRLSVNIRFESGSATLDNKAQQDILRLSQFMKTPENSEKKLLLIGFGDSKETDKRSLILSKLRAITVKSALKSQGLYTLPIQGMGSELPVADNNSGNKVKNQRVEVWLL